MFSQATRIGEVKTSIDNTTGQRSLFLDSSIFFFSTRLAFFSTQISKFRLVFFFSFVNIYFANLDSFFLLHSMYFTSFDLRIMFSTCFYYRYNFVRNGTPQKSRGNRFWFELARGSSQRGFELSGVNCILFSRDSRAAILVRTNLVGFDSFVLRNLHNCCPCE